MTVKFAENIKRLRKEHHMTQEQLAEALNVSVGAVYKWESERSLPEVNMIIDIANLFELSIDALLGYDIPHDTAEHIARQLQSLRKESKFAEAVEISDRALAKYPNHFDIVYSSALLYHVVGIVENDDDALERSVTLLNRALPLLDQNRDTEINEVSIKNQIASCYSHKREIDKALDVYKDNNINGINDAVIGYIIASEKNDVDDSARFLSHAFSNVLINTIHIMFGWINFYNKKQEYIKAEETVSWLISFLQGIKVDGKRNSSIDKIIIVLYASLADYAMHFDRDKSAEQYLHKAYALAIEYDNQDPDNSLSGLKFFSAAHEKPVTYDSLPNSAIEAIEESVMDEKTDCKIRQLWEKIKYENR